MDCIISEPVRILAHGHTEQRICYRDIETDIPFLEKEAHRHSENNGLLPRLCFNSAEQYNMELRRAYSVIKSYALGEIQKSYYTTEFKKFKYSQIISSSTYLLKVIKLIENINHVFIDIVRRAEGEAERNNSKSEKVNELYRAERMCSGVFSLLWDASINLLDLQSDSHSIGIQKAIDKGHELIQLVLKTHYLPVGLANKINSVFPHVTLRTFDYAAFLNCEFDTGVYNNFMQVEEKLISIMTILIRFLEFQFSYYVTSESFLNNPIGRTLFVIPMSLYRKFNFPNSGLYKSEQFVFTQEEPVKMAQKNLEFIRVVKDSFSKTKVEAESLLENIRHSDNSFSIFNFIELYRKKHPVEKMERLITILESPVTLERTTAMLIETRTFMVSDAQNGKDPWYCKNPNKFKSIDKDTLFFLMRLFERSDEQLKCVPLTKILRLFNLFSYSNQPEKRMNDHVRNYRNGNYRISQNYEATFGAIMRR